MTRRRSGVLLPSPFLAFSLAPLPSRARAADRAARLAEATQTFQRASAGDAGAVPRALPTPASGRPVEPSP